MGAQGQAGGLWLQEGDAVSSWLLCGGPTDQPKMPGTPFCWPGSGACNLGEQRSGTQQHEECSAKEASGKMIWEIQGEQTKGRTTWVQTLQETPSADQVRRGWQHHACKGWNHVREGPCAAQERGALPRAGVLRAPPGSRPATETLPQ